MVLFSGGEYGIAEEGQTLVGLRWPSNDGGLEACAEHLLRLAGIDQNDPPEKM